MNEVIIGLKSSFGILGISSVARLNLAARIEYLKKHTRSLNKLPTSGNGLPESNCAVSLTGLLWMTAQSTPVHNIYDYPSARHVTMEQNTFVMNLIKAGKSTSSIPAELEAKYNGGVDWLQGTSRICVKCIFKSER